MVDEYDDEGRLLWTGDCKKSPNMPRMRSFRKAMDANEPRKSKVNNMHNQDRMR